MTVRLRAWFLSVAPPDGDADGDLVRRFVATRDEAAFAELVRRHGPMVLGTCRRLVHPDTHAADDAFQATFLVLATKATTVSPPERVGAWLHGVAVHVARKAGARAKKLAPAAELDWVPDRTSNPDPELSDVRATLDEVLAGLPSKYRAPVVLCDLEQRSRADAAAALGWTEGTLSGRLARARKLLAVRLARRGVVLGGVLPAAAVPAVVPGALTAATLQAASLVAAGCAGDIPPTVSALAHGVPSMHSTFKRFTAGFAGVGIVLAGVGLYAVTAADPPAPPQPPKADSPPKVEVAKESARDVPVAVRPVWVARHTFTYGSAIGAVAIGPDVIAAGDELGMLDLWDPATGKRVERLKEGTDGGGRPAVDGLAFSADGKWLYLVLNRGGAFHQATVRREGRDWNGFGDSGEYVHYGMTTDGKHWLRRKTPAGDLEVLKNNPAAGKFTETVVARFPHARKVYGAAGNGDAIVSVAGFGPPVLRRWQLDKDRPVWEVNIDRMDVNGVALGPGGKRVAVFGDAGQVRVFDGATGREVARADKLTGPVIAAAFDPDGRRLVVGCANETARVLDVETGRELAELTGHQGAMTAVAFGPNGRIVTGSMDKTVKVWEVK